MFTIFKICEINRFQSLDIPTFCCNFAIPFPLKEVLRYQLPPYRVKVLILISQA